MASAAAAPAAVFEHKDDAGAKNCGAEDKQTFHRSFGGNIPGKGTMERSAGLSSIGKIGKFLPTE